MIEMVTGSDKSECKTSVSAKPGMGKTSSLAYLANMWSENPGT